MKNNKRGFITIDFIFAMFVSFGLVVILFAMTFTLSVVEITQYIAFAASRAHSAGHVSVNDQAELAFKKYQELTTNKVLAPLYSNGWFTISKPDQMQIKSGNGDTFDNEYGDEKKYAPFIGVRFNLSAHVLNIKFPLLGSQDDDDFSLRIASFLIREPTSEECQKFMETSSRFKAIMDLDPRFNSVPGVSTKYIPMEDNGC